MKLKHVLKRVLVMIEVICLSLALSPMVISKAISMVMVIPSKDCILQMGCIVDCSEFVRGQ